MADHSTGNVTKIFVYGTLKKGHCNYYLLLAGTMPSVLAKARFIRSAVTKPQYAMYDCGGYPGLVYDHTSGEAIHGEVWEVNDGLLKTLHSLEGVDQGLYHFNSINLAHSDDDEEVFAYFYAKNINGFCKIPEVWPQELDYGRRKNRE